MYKLAEYIKKSGWSRKDFSKLIGIHPNYLGAFCRHLLRPGKYLAEKIEDVTDGEVTVEYLRSYDLEKPKKLVPRSPTDK